MPKSLLVPERHDEIRVRSRGYMPHWQLDHALYFLTFHLIDSLPRAALESLREYRRSLTYLITRGERELTAIENTEVRRLYERALDDRLDAGHGACHLRNPPVAELVVGALRYHDANLYDLLAYVVMPNHVHVLLALFDGDLLPFVLHSWKSYTSHRANELLGRRGKFWQHEYWDRIVRGPEDLATVRSYILNNPLKVGMLDWPYVWSAP